MVKIQTESQPCMNVNRHQCTRINSYQCNFYHLVSLSRARWARCWARWDVLFQISDGQNFIAGYILPQGHKYIHPRTCLTVQCWAISFEPRPTGLVYLFVWDDRKSHDCVWLVLERSAAHLWIWSCRLDLTGAKPSISSKKIMDGRIWYALCQCDRKWKHTVSY